MLNIKQNKIAFSVTLIGVLMLLVLLVVSIRSTEYVCAGRTVQINTETPSIVQVIDRGFMFSALIDETLYESGILSDSTINNKKVQIHTDFLKTTINGQTVFIVKHDKSVSYITHCVKKE